MLILIISKFQYYDHVHNIKDFQSNQKSQNSNHWFPRYFKLSEAYKTDKTRRKPDITADITEDRRVYPDFIRVTRTRIETLPHCNWFKLIIAKNKMEIELFCFQ